MVLIVDGAFENSRMKCRLCFWRYEFCCVVCNRSIYISARGLADGILAAIGVIFVALTQITNSVERRRRPAGASCTHMTTAILVARPIDMMK